MNVRLGPRATIIFSVNTALTMNTSAALLLLLAAFTPFAHAAQQDLQPGALLPKITTTKDTHQSYALYLPSNYTAAKHWPVVYAFDPAARGALPVGLLKDAAEKYGYIVAGSNNSRNGSGQLEGEAAQAMFDDTHARLSIDDRRIYSGRIFRRRPPLRRTRPALRLRRWRNPRRRRFPARSSRLLRRFLRHRLLRLQLRRNDRPR